MMDNKIFNVNGRGRQMLVEALRLAFKQEGEKTVCRGWIHSINHGIILLWGGDEDNARFINRLPAMGPDEISSVVEAYLESDAGRAVVCQGWDADEDHDGHNSPGWRVYCEDWGHVNGNPYAICAVKPTYLWHGK